MNIPTTQASETLSTVCTRSLNYHSKSKPQNTDTKVIICNRNNWQNITVAAHSGLPLQGQARLHAALQAIFEATSWVLHTGLVSMDRGRWGMSGESAAKSSENGTVSGLKSDNYRERLAELGLPTLEERRHQADMTMIHKIMNGRGELDPLQWFEAGSERVTRS